MTEEVKRVVKLIMVTDKLKKGNNKYYDMSENGDGTWTANYGRVGDAMPPKTYPMERWDKKYREKIRKGYRDITELCAVDGGSVGFADISDSVVASIVRDLQGFANKSVSQNYLVTSESVTARQVEEAQVIINDIVPLIEIGQETTQINNLLLQLFQVIPRRMANVKDYLLPFPSIRSNEMLNKANKLLSKEQDTLDVMEGQVKVSSIQKEQTSDNQMTIIQAMGLEINPINQTMKSIILAELGEIQGRFSKGFSVTNKKTQRRFNDLVYQAANKSTKLFWHGSRNENWWSIVENGLIIRPSCAVYTGSMFGDGIYFADKARKSLGYSSLKGSYWTNGTSHRGFMSLYEVHVGKQMVIGRHGSWCKSLNRQKISKEGGYDSVFAKGGYDLRNNEYIVYDSGQCTIKYLVELR